MLGAENDFMGLLGGAEPRRRHILKLAQYRRGLARGVAEQPLGRRGVLKAVELVKELVRECCVKSVTMFLLAMFYSTCFVVIGEK